MTVIWTLRQVEQPAVNGSTEGHESNGRSKKAVASEIIKTTQNDFG